MKTSVLLSGLIAFSFIGLPGPHLFKDAFNLQPGFKTHLTSPNLVSEEKKEKEKINNTIFFKPPLPRYLWRTFENSVKKTGSLERT